MYIIYRVYIYIYIYYVYDSIYIYILYVYDDLWGQHLNSSLVLASA